VNLKYLGLVALSRLIDIHLPGALEYRDVVLKCLEDDDVSLRYRALEIVIKMMNPGNFAAITNKLVCVLEEESSTHTFRGHVVTSIINAASKDIYTLVEGDMEFFVGILVKLAGYCTDGIVGRTIIDVCVRVNELRAYTVMSICAELERDVESVVDMKDVAWAIGEFNPDEEVAAVVDILIKICVDGTRSNAIGVCVDAVVKLCIRYPASVDVRAVVDGLERILDSSSLDIQAQDQANMGIVILQTMMESSDSGTELYAGELTPVSMHAQDNVPDCLVDLDSWINVDLSVPEPITVCVPFI
jgi:hypothetical protein